MSTPSKLRSRLIVLVLVLFPAMGALLARSAYRVAFGAQPFREATLKREAFEAFHSVRLPERVLAYRSRAHDLTDPTVQELVRLDPADRAAFLASNGLAEVTAERPLNPAVVADVAAAASPHGTARVIPLDGPGLALALDGGAKTGRSTVALLEFDDQLWVYLQQ